MAPIGALRLARFSDDTLLAGPGAVLPAARNAMAILDDHLAGEGGGERAWLVGERPTVADVAVFGTAAVAPDAGVMIEDYPAVWRWMGRFRHLPGFIVMPGVFPVIPELVEPA
nr:glutathione S-transferase C-terminal domain-containing protein [Acuticoccus mangrovi]